MLVCGSVRGSATYGLIGQVPDYVPSAQNADNEDIAIIIDPVIDGVASIHASTIAGPDFVDGLKEQRVPSNLCQTGLEPVSIA